MYNSNIPNDRELPSTGKLIKSTILATIGAAILLVTVVMPAEYGIDPTGIGNTIGLKKMGEIKMSLAQEAKAEQAAAEAAVAEPEPVIIQAQEVQPEVAVTTETQEIAVQEEPVAEVDQSIRSDEMSVTLAPNEGTEIKVVLAKGKSVEYSWSTDGGKANFDIHGDSKELKIDYHNYSKGSEQSSSGILEAAFDGSHGWFWRNRTSETITVTLKVSGEYTDIKHYK